jgi:DNA-binding transcriptional MerR regulator
MPAGRAVTTMTISQLARRIGVRPDTIRYYERIGLLDPPERTSGDHRRYDLATVDRLLFIKGTQRLDLELGEIAELLAVRDTGECPCQPAQAVLGRHVTKIDAEIARLSALRGELTRMLAGFPGPVCPEPAPGTWCPPSEPARR